MTHNIIWSRDTSQGSLMTKDDEFRCVLRQRPNNGAHYPQNIRSLASISIPIYSHK